MTGIAVVGAGFSGLTAACFLAREGFKVIVLEKNETAGGRAQQFKTDGFTFDMGPSWYCMRDAFERFCHPFGKTLDHYYTHERISRSYHVAYGKDDMLDVPTNLCSLYAMFERLEPGSANSLEKFLRERKYKYDIGIQKLVYKPGLSSTNFWILM